MDSQHYLAHSVRYRKKSYSSLVILSTAPPQVINTVTCSSSEYFFLFQPLGMNNSMELLNGALYMLPHNYTIQTSR